MKCRDFELRVRELVKQHGADLRDSALSEHAQRCEKCSRRLEEERHLESQLSRLASSFQGLVPPPDLQHQIRRAYQTETGTVRQLRPEVGRPDRTPHWLLAAATIVVAVAAVWLYTITTSREPAIQSSSEITREARRGPSPSAGTRPIDFGTPPEQMYSEFILIGNCRSLDCLDRARMMRIDLPRSSVSYFGIPRTRIQSPGDRIVADVLIGEDGIARAIRFVY